MRVIVSSCEFQSREEEPVVVMILNKRSLIQVLTLLKRAVKPHSSQYTLLACQGNTQ